MTEYRYHRMHVPSGRQSIVSTYAWTRLEFLQNLDRWNGQQPGVWHYWSVL